MKTLLLTALVASLAVALPSQEKTKKLEITKEMQQSIDDWKKTAAQWAADKAVVAAVVAQNAKGPIEGMDNKKWKTLRRRDAEVEQFTTNEAAKALAAKVKASNGVVGEAFVCAAKSEKVAFLEKTTSYLHAGAAKFDVPFGKLQVWQSEPSFDESTQTHSIQIAVPVLDPKDEKHAIGVLVIGLDGTALANAKPAPAK